MQSSGPDQERLTRDTALTVMLAGAVLGVLAVVSDYNYLLFHSLVEIFSVAVAWAVFFLAWNTRRTVDNGYLLFMGLAFLPIGVLDLVHTLAYQGMNVFPGPGPNLSTVLWIQARSLQAGAMALAPLALGRRLRAGWVLTALCALAAVLIWAAFQGHFPACYVQGQGLTLFKKTAEYVISAVLVLAALTLYRVRGRFDPAAMRLLMAAIVLTILSELSFTMYLSVYGRANMVGHFFKAGAFYLLYRALLETGLTRPLDLLFRDLKQSEQALRVSEQRFRVVFENAPIGLVRLDGQGRVKDCNAMFTRLLGAGREAVLGMDSMADLKNHDLRQAVAQALGGRPSSWEGQYEFVTAPGQAALRVVLNPILGEDKAVAGIISSVEDIAERRQAEVLREEVERITRHDLKGPLNGIIGLPSLLMDDPNLTADQRRSMQLISDAGFRMLGMINVSLDLYKMETGRYEFRPATMDLLDVVRSILAEMRQRARDAQVETQVLLDGQEARAGDVFLVQGEELLCYSMLANLVENAVEASPKNGRVLVGLRRDKGWAVIEVHNMGAVPEAVQERFFEKFATHGKAGGTGLGAYSALLVARVHKGDISLTTSEAEGTTVVVRLPE